MKLFVSSVAFGDLSITEIGALASQHGLSIEFSANFNPNDQLIEEFLSLEIDRMPHNYFPPSVKPFVLNLASQNETILSRSKKHCFQGVELANQCGSSFFSAHAGFCMDPDPTTLGKQLKQPQVIDRDLHWRRFIESVEEIGEFASKKNVKFVLENNVLSKSNLREDGINPLFCVEADEIIRCLNELKSGSVGFLLDTAHLKVSSNTLGFDLDDAVEQLLSKVDYVHHSDNNGLVDNNERITNNYWFLKYMTDLEEAVHVIEVKNQGVEAIMEQIDLLKKSVK